MSVEFRQVQVDDDLERDFRDLVRLAVREDFSNQFDWTTIALVSKDSKGACEVVAREPGVCAGLVLLPWLADEMDLDLTIETLARDGDFVSAGTSVVKFRGSSRAILSSERIILNTLCRMFGIASHTKRFVDELRGTGAKLYDTRKTTLGWRRLDKYAVQCGGAANHRAGLYDAFLIKDNHLALAGGDSPLHTDDAVRKAQSMTEHKGLPAPEIIEIEVDTLAQFENAIDARPHIVLLDNFTLIQLEEAVMLRDRRCPSIQLEASGNVKIDTLAAIAATGVDRISSGALTHAARWLDLGLDWSHSP